MNYKNTKLTFVSLAVSMALSHAAQAEQHNKNKTESEEDMETIVVNATSMGKYHAANTTSHKFPKPLLDTPRTINVLSAELLRDQNVDTLNDALRNVAGVSTFGAGEGGGGDLTTNDTITIRGFDADNSIFIDDIRDIAGYSRDLFNVEAIEVTKGGNSSIIGKASAGGTVSLITKKARQKKQGFVDVAANTADNKRVHVDYNTPVNKDLAVRVNALFSEGNDPLDNGVVEFNSYALAPAVGYTLSEQTDLSLDFLFMKQENLPSLGLPFVTEAVAASTGLAEGPISEDLWDNYYGVASRDFEDVDVTMGTLIINHMISDDLKLRFASRIASNEKQSITGRPNFLNEGTRAEPDYTNQLVSTALVLPGLAYIDARDEQNDLFVTQLDAIYSFDAGSVTHDLVFGTEYYVDELTKFDISSTSVQLSVPGISLTNPAQNVTFTGEYARLPEPAKTKGKGLAFYALDTITLNEQWNVSLGLRSENYELKGSQYFTDRQGPERTRVRVLAQGLASDVTLFSWNAGIVYKPSANSSVYASAVNSQEPLGGNLRFSGFSETDLRTRTSIDPEDSHTYELGAKYELFDKKLLVSGALFETQRTIIDQAGRGEPVSLSGEQTSKGFEIAAIGQVNDNLSISANYTNLDTEVTQTAQTDQADLGNGLSAAPDETASLWVNYTPEFAAGKFTVGGGMQYSSGDVFFRRNRAYFETGSFTVWSLLARYQVTDAIRVQGNVSNLFDDKYITDFSARGHFRPGAPRIVNISVSYDF